MRALALLLALTLAAPAAAQDPAETEPLPDVIPGAALVLDGDTLEVRGRPIHLFGIDAPELSSSDGWKARAYLEALIGGRPVRCAPITRDRHQDLVARCQVAGHPVYGTIHLAHIMVFDYGTIHLAHIMVFDGYAVEDRRTSHQNPALAQLYRDAEATARRLKSGLWGE
jgi:endonuclease YncB( thermonuclease family)